jgi:hypothetical protein
MTSKTCSAWAVALIVLGIGSDRLRGENIDLKLYAEAHAIVEQLHKQGAKNVGVLHFRSQKGNGPESFNLGTISSSMATRLQNALILHMPMDQPFGLTRDASATAAARKVGAWHKSIAERKKLFTLAYPPAWGSAPIKPNIFLTGVVRLNPPPKKASDLETTTVVIQAFTAKEPEKRIKLHEFTVATDRHILREFGQSFALSARSLRGSGKGLSSLNRDQRAVRDARRRDIGDASEGEVSPDNLFGLSVKIFYDGVEQTAIQPDTNSRGEWRVQPPAPGAKVTFQVRNSGGRAALLGAALSLNGRSFWQQQTGDVIPEQIWLFNADAQKTTEFAGFYMDIAGKNLIPFKVLSPQESQARESEFGDRVGLLNVDVYESRPGEPKDDGEMQISLARSSRPLRKPARALNTLKDAKAAVILSDAKLFARERTSALKRNLIVPSDAPPQEGGEIVLRDLPNPVRLGGITIRYYDPKRGGSSAENLQISN